MAAKSVKETTVYQNDLALAMEIFEISKRFPIEERYSLKTVFKKCLHLFTVSLPKKKIRCAFHF